MSDEGLGTVAIMAATESRTAKGPPLAGKASAMDLPLRSNIMFMAERHRGLPRKTDTPTVDARRLSLRRRPAGGHRSGHQRAQPRTAPIRLEGRSRGNHGRRQTGAPSVGIRPLA